MNAPDWQRSIGRRCFVRQSALGLGSIALADLLRGDATANSGAQRPGPLAPRQPHFAARAKRVIFLFMAGAPSQLDLFDPKPELVKRHGEPVPESLLATLKDPLVKGSARCMASPRVFARHGESGLEFSDYLPHLAQCADQLCMIRSLHTDTSNHDPGQLMMQCGVPRFGAPGMGAWVTYGLGSESQNLPGFAVLLSNNGPGDLAGTALWDNAFLPAAYRGVTLRSEGDPILHLANPEGVTANEQRERLAVINDLNRARYAQQADPEILSRIDAYELAFRMQSAAPALQDISDETEATQQLYGLDQPETKNFGRQCLMARRFIERGVRFVQCTHSYKWDQHSGLRADHSKNAREVDQPIAALLQDLAARGLLKDTLVLWGGEFGRTPVAQGDDGRDHNPQGYTMWLAGGGVKPGIRYGATDDYGYFAVQNKVHVHDLHATMLHLLGIDHTKLTYKYAGRDFRLTDVYGEVVHDIIA
jgi:hypothetical protein